jgi:hypothetical protein
MQGNIFQQAGYLALHADAAIARATLSDWVPTFALSGDGLLFALAFAGALWLTFVLVWQLVAGSEAADTYVPCDARRTLAATYHRIDNLEISLMKTRLRSALSAAIMCCGGRRWQRIRCGSIRRSRARHRPRQRRRRHRAVHVRHGSQCPICRRCANKWPQSAPRGILRRAPS